MSSTFHPAGEVVTAPRYYLGAYWGPRQESLDACADRATRFLAGLRSLSAIFEDWYRQGGSRAKAIQYGVVAERDAVRSLLESGQNRRDSDRSVIEELGYSMSIWNGREPSAGLSVGCGKFPQTEHVKNAVVLTLPRSDDELVDLSRPATAKAMMRLMVECWEPDWATWTSREWRSEQGSVESQPVFGWMTYLSWPCDPRALPSGATVEALGPGRLIAAADSLARVTGTALLAIREGLKDSL